MRTFKRLRGREVITGGTNVEPLPVAGVNEAPVVYLKDPVVESQVLTGLSRNVVSIGGTGIGPTGRSTIGGSDMGGGGGVLGG